MFDVPSIRCALVAACFSSLIAAPAPADDGQDAGPSSAQGVPTSDFSFLEGRWQVVNRRLKGRMSGSDEWVEYPMNYEFTTLLGGLANVDRIHGSLGGKPYEALNFRAYDPDKNEWVVYWMSRSYPHLTEQVRGRFVDGAGEFYGREEHQGRSYRMRFRWKRLAEDRAYWDQSYQDPDSGAWEINWTMQLQRAP